MKTYVQNISGKIDGDFDKNLFSFLDILTLRWTIYISSEGIYKEFTIQSSYKNRCSGKISSDWDRLAIYMWTKEICDQIWMNSSMLDIWWRQHLILYNKKFFPHLPWLCTIGNGTLTNVSKTLQNVWNVRFTKTSKTSGLQILFKNVCKKHQYSVFAKICRFCCSHVCSPVFFSLF